MIGVVNNESSPERSLIDQVSLPNFALPAAVDPWKLALGLIFAYTAFKWLSGRRII